MMMPDFTACHRAADEICALLDCYGTSSGNFLPKFRDHLLPLVHVTDRVFRNAGKKLPLLAA